MKKILSHLAPVDFVSIVFMLFLIGLNLIFFGRVSAWLEIIVIDLVVIAVIFLLAYLAETKKTKLLIGLHRFYSYLFVFFVFKKKKNLMNLSKKFLQYSANALEFPWTHAAFTISGWLKRAKSRKNNV